MKLVNKSFSFTLNTTKKVWICATKQVLFKVRLQILFPPNLRVLINFHSTGNNQSNGFLIILGQTEVSEFAQICFIY